MCAKWYQNTNPGSVIAEINKIRRERNGRVVFKGLGIEWLESALLSAVKFNPQVPKGLFHSILRAALSRTTMSARLSDKQLLAQITQEEQNYLKKPIQELYVRTSLSVAGASLFHRRQFSVIRISFDGVAKFDQSTVAERARGSLHGKLPEIYRAVVLGILARSCQEAIDGSLDEFDVVRGLWNLYVNANQTLRISIAGTPKPVNQFRRGPIYTIHHRDGSLAAEGFWFDPNYIDVGDLYHIDSAASIALLRNLVEPLKLMNRSPLKADSYEGIRRYCRALDYWNLNQAFTELWAVLEYLTDTSASSYDVTIRRAAAMWKDYQFSLEVLKHLRACRNRLIHATETRHDVETLVHQLKLYVEKLLRFYIVNPEKLQERREIGEFLDAPRDRVTLERRLRVLSAWRRFHGRHLA